MMNWPQLLCPGRLGESKPAVPDPARSPYTIDSDRIVFSSAFRRLQDKTQVFPLADNDYVRTRLTHSLEVASVARSLGARVGAAIVEKYRLAPEFHASDFGAIVSAAALAHDLGNPPFGHSGEDAISHWFRHSPVARASREELDAIQRADLESFEGNAQGFRVVTRLQMPDNPGLRLTCATLGAFTKYPRASTLTGEKPTGVSAKKFGFFQAEQDFFREIAGRTGLIPRANAGALWSRHPLAFLVEAADDICYRLVDYEDGFRLKHLSYEEVLQAFVAVTGAERNRESAERMAEEKDRIAFLRARAIGSAIEQTADAFMEHEEAMLAGTFDQELLDLIPSAEALRAIKVRSRKTIYATQRGVEIEAAGYEVLGGLLDVFYGAADDVARQAGQATPKSKKLLSLVPSQFLNPDRSPSRDTYERIMKMTDFVSGMTDSYAVSLYQKVRGISL
ncbi:MAG: deoxyguanosinetriphosphate triphosphohydrolase [Chthoniobacteraceae bacterium]